MRIMSNVAKFAENSTDLYEAFKEYSECKKGNKAFADVSKDDMEKAINIAFLSEIEERTGYSRKSALSDKKWANNSMVVEMADEIVSYLIDMILPDQLLDSAMAHFCDFRFADLGDSMTFKLKNNGLFLVSKAGTRRKHSPVQRLYEGSATLVPELRQLSVATDLYEVILGRESIAELVYKAVLSIQVSVYKDAYTAFDAVMESLSAPLVTVNPTEAQLIEACERVTAWNGGAKAVIIGTPIALKGVLPDNNNYRYTLEDDYVKVGYVSTFNGYDVIALEQVADPYDTTTPYAMALRNDRIYVISPATDKLVKVGFGGETMSYVDGDHDNANLLQIATLTKAWDSQVITNSIAWVGQITG